MSPFFSTSPSKSHFSSKMAESDSKKIKLEELHKVCLIMIDGWGISGETNGNAVFHAKTPVMTALAKEYPVKPPTSSVTF